VVAIAAARRVRGFAVNVIAGEGDALAGVEAEDVVLAASASCLR